VDAQVKSAGHLDHRIAMCPGEIVKNRTTPQSSRTQPAHICDLMQPCRLRAGPTRKPSTACRRRPAWRRGAY